MAEPTPDTGKIPKAPKAPRAPSFVEKSKGPEAENFDFAALRPQAHRTNLVESIGHLIKSCLGGGIVSVHETYKKNGLISSAILNFILGAFVTYCMIILCKCAQKMYGRVHVTSLSYPDLAEASCDIAPFPKVRRYARTIRYIVDVIIMIDLFGSCCCYQVLMAKSCRDLMALTGVASTDWSVRAWIAICIIPCILSCWILQLKYLAPFSIFGDVVILVVAILTVYYGCGSKYNAFSLPNYKGIGGLVGYIGAMVFTIEGIGAALPIENHLKNPKDMGKVLWIGMFIVTIIVIAVGFFGYWGWGEQSEAPVTINFPQDAFSVVLRVSMLLMIYVTFPVNFWYPFDLVWFYLKNKHPEEKNWFWHRLYRTGVVLIISILTLIFPSIVDLMSVIGAFCLSNMGFIFPSLIELVVDWEYPGLGQYKWRLWKCVAIVVWGVFLLIIGTVLNVKSLIEEVYFKK